ncbi:hypothetical protein FSARC_8866 [Fusarium sarcochroum]|uniref:Uncharacterized protein n=1 Tax=Fusarium sarcochroum TaxID=1208366 RepID=A0A8H4X5X3_9HYPO|nr:hypothetical protein FSARC_8866 [Fusarium sarcochroum]
MPGPADHVFHNSIVARNIVSHLTGKDAVAATYVTRELWISGSLWRKHIESLLGLPYNTYTSTSNPPHYARAVYRRLCQTINKVGLERVPVSRLYDIGEPESSDHLVFSKSGTILLFRLLAEEHETDIHFLDQGGLRLLHKSTDIVPIGMCIKDTYCTGREAGFMVTRRIKDWSLVARSENKSDEFHKPPQEWIPHDMCLLRLYRKGALQGNVEICTVKGESLALLQHSMVDGVKSLADGQLLTFSNSEIKIWDINSRSCLATSEFKDICQVDESGGFLIVRLSDDTYGQTVDGGPTPKVFVHHFAYRNGWRTFSDGTHVAYEDDELAVFVPNLTDPEVNLIRP